MTPAIIESLEKLLGGPRDNALLHYALGHEWIKAGDPHKAIPCLQEALTRDPQYSAAWKLLGKALTLANTPTEALKVYQQGIAIATARGDLQAAKEMEVFAKRLLKQETAASTPPETR